MCIRDSNNVKFKVEKMDTYDDNWVSHPMFPLEFRGEINREETSVMGLSYTEDLMIVA